MTKACMFFRVVVVSIDRVHEELSFSVILFACDYDPPNSLVSLTTTE
jgi:hypothetical protein